MKWAVAFKGYFLSPPFAIVFSYCFALSLTLVFVVFFPQIATWVTLDWQLLDVMTMICYAAAIVSLLCFFRDFKSCGKLPDFGAYFFLLLAAAARERGIQHWLSSTDSTAIKINFFTNPENPLSEKILTLFLLTLVVGAAGYVLCKYARNVVSGFFKGDTLSWSVVSLGICGLIAKAIDRLPHGPISKILNFKELHGEYLELHLTNISVLEECCEMLIPINAILILWQFHLIYRTKKQNTSELS